MADLGLPIWLAFNCTLLTATVSAQQYSADSSNTGQLNREECHCTCRKSGNWLIAETDNFSVWTHLSQARTEHLATWCETHRAALRNSWLGEVLSDSWNPKCVVVLHRDSAEFGRHFGNSHQLPVACTTVTEDHGRVIFRRVDLRGDAADWQLNALPHELTHVALADRFTSQPIPCWLNEGIAMTFETPQLRQRRLEVLRTELSRGRSLNARKVLAARDLSSAGSHTDLYYAASLSMVSFLQTQGGAHRLLRFAETATASGTDAALKSIYDISGGVQELERRWLNSLAVSEPAASATASR